MSTMLLQCVHVCVHVIFISVLLFLFSPQCRYMFMMVVVKHFVSWRDFASHSVQNFCALFILVIVFSLITIYMLQLWPMHLEV